MLNGDQGQIPPVVACEVERWRSDPSGPHVDSPRALLGRHPWVQRLALPVSRRLVPDTVRLVQPAFYPDLPFTALSAPGDCALATTVPGAGALDDVIALAEGGASVVRAELPPAITGPVDDELAEAVVGLLAGLVELGAVVVDGGAARPLRGEMIGVACAHVAQVNAVRGRLPEALAGTADRF